mmetsp:Transcript_22022/g.54433  ORF Transcript_22022/g.54433 Transcript_22022/m.54433 type:complete len:113 (-) Transcript_22022:254-592(-)
MGDPGRPILQGDQVVIHCGRMQEVGVLSRFIKLVRKGKADDDATSIPPRMVNKGQSIVVDISMSHPICVQRFSESKVMGRFILRMGSSIIGAGVVLDLDVEQPPEVKPATGT